MVMIKPDICIYHGNCADGFGAAWAVWSRFGDEVQLIPGVYGRDPPTNVVGKVVALVDFTYKRSILEAMAAVAKRVIVLDHHKTAQADLEPYIVASASEMGTERVTALFDMEKSGAVMAWEYFHPDAPVPRLLSWVEDRDLWRFKLARSRDMAAYIFSQPYDLRTWSTMVEQAETIDWVSMADQGAAIERKHHKDIRELLEQTRRTMRIGGFEVPVANLPYTMASDAGQILAEGAYFAACYFDRNDGQRIFSLRSLGSFDVSEIAKKYGGGGHKNAAGFQVPLGWEGD